MKYSFGLLLFFVYLLVVFITIILDHLDPQAIDLEKLLQFSFVLNVLYFIYKYKKERLNAK